MYLQKCDVESKSNSGREEFNSIEEALESVADDKAWELADGR